MATETQETEAERLVKQRTRIVEISTPERVKLVRIDFVDYNDVVLESVRIEKNERKKIACTARIDLWARTRKIKAYDALTGEVLRYMVLEDSPGNLMLTIK